MERFDVIIAGAGAAGMMCAIEAGKRGRRVLVVDHARAPGEKIRISGGGRCNFTNIGTEPKNFLGQNPKFCVSALRRYTPRDFIALVEKHRIAWHEKTLGQLFCDDSAKQIVRMLLDEMKAAGVELRLETAIDRVAKTDAGFEVAMGGRAAACESFVVATGGKSIPKMGATGWAYDVARQFGLPVVDTRPGLVPLTFEIGLLERLKPLAGVAVDARVTAGNGKSGCAFDEAMLFTHRGLSGPAILQASSYWREGEAIEVDMAPGTDVLAALKQARRETPKRALPTVLHQWLPDRLAHHVAAEAGAQGNIADASDKVLAAAASLTNAWRVKPVGSEGYRTAEVTLGGVDWQPWNAR